MSTAVKPSINHFLKNSTRSFNLLKIKVLWCMRTEIHTYTHTLYAPLLFQKNVSSKSIDLVEGSEKQKCLRASSLLPVL